MALGSPWHGTPATVGGGAFRLMLIRYMQCSMYTTLLLALSIDIQRRPVRTTPAAAASGAGQITCLLALLLGSLVSATTTTRVPFRLKCCGFVTSHAAGPSSTRAAVFDYLDFPNDPTAESPRICWFYLPTATRPLETRKIPGSRPGSRLHQSFGVASR